MDIGVLFGNFKLQRRLARFVLGQGGQKIGAAQQGGAANVVRRKFIPIRGQIQREIKLHGSDGFEWNAKGIGNLRARFGLLALQIDQVRACSEHRHPGWKKVGAGNSPRLQSLLHQLQDDLFALQLGFEGLLPQRRSDEIQYVRAQRRAHLPGSGDDIEARRCRELLRALDTAAAFTGRFDRQIKRHFWNPRGETAGGVEVEPWKQADGRVGPATRRANGCFGRAPLGPGQIEVGMIIERDQRQLIEVPFFRRMPLPSARNLVCGQESLEAGIVQRALFKAGESFVGFNFSILEADAPGQSAKQDEDAIPKGRHELSFSAR